MFFRTPMSWIGGKNGLRAAAREKGVLEAEKKPRLRAVPLAVPVA